MKSLPEYSPTFWMDNHWGFSWVLYWELSGGQQEFYEVANKSSLSIIFLFGTNVYPTTSYSESFQEFR